MTIDQPLARHFSRIAILILTLTFCASAQNLARQGSQASGEKPSAAERKVNKATAQRSPWVLKELSGELTALADRVSPAVVQVLVSSYGPVEGSAEGEQTAVVARQNSLGSGVIVDPNGYIITNAHVVNGAQHVRVILTERNESSNDAGTEPFPAITHKTLDARIVGRHVESDLALLKVEATGLPYLPIPEHSIAKEGELVVAVGSPQGLESSVTMGIVSSPARQADPNRAIMYIQTDAPINPGNSGGPLVDADGNLLGINTFILTQSGGSEGLGFAIPMQIVRFVYEQLREHGHVHRVVVGAAAQTITPALAKALSLPQDWGVIIDDVTPGSPAEAAGVKIGDIVLSLDGRRIDSMPRFQAGLYLHSPKELVRLDVLRGGQKVSLNIPAIEQSDNMDQITAMIDPENDVVPRFGIIAIGIDRKLAELLPDLRIPSGVIVVARTATYRPIELMQGDVIHAFNGTSITTLQQLREASRKLKPGDAVALQIERDGGLSYVSFEWD